MRILRSNNRSIDNSRSFIGYTITSSTSVTIVLTKSFTLIILFTSFLPECKDVFWPAFMTCLQNLHCQGRMTQSEAKQMSRREALDNANLRAPKSEGQKTFVPWSVKNIKKDSL